MPLLGPRIMRVIETGGASGTLHLSGEFMREGAWKKRSRFGLVFILDKKRMYYTLTNIFVSGKAYAKWLGTKKPASRKSPANNRKDRDIERCDKNTLSHVYTYNHTPHLYKYISILYVELYYCFLQTTTLKQPSSIKKATRAKKKHRQRFTYAK